ncbi:MAG: NAD-dependent epimerase/dehydratase family protein [Solirubrobacterales bacterium]
MSRVMLTGATGFVGRHALTALADAGHEVHAVARRRGADADRVSWHEADLLAGCDVVRDIEPEVLVHLAWYAEHGMYWSSPENVRWVEGSLALLRAFAAARGRRAVIAGTCAEYEWSRDLYPESAPLRPATLYGAAKHGLHVVASAFLQQAEIELAWGRLFFLYGPHEAPERFVPSLVRSLLAGEVAPMSDGEQRRDFLHVADAGAAFAALADSSLTGAVNIASGDAVALRDLARQVASLAGDVDLLRIGAIPRRENEPPSLLADVSRLREDLGWMPRIALEDGLRDTVAWWRERSHAGGSARP